MKTRLAALFCLLLGSVPASGQGIIIVPDRPGTTVPPSAVYLRELRLEIRIEAQTAVTKVRHTFYNPSDARLEGMFYHPLPEDAAITDFALWVGGVKTKGEVLPRDQARSIYEGIVRRQRDPGLLEFVGTGLFQARIFPIEPRSEQKVEIEYAEVLRSDAGLSRYSYPLRLHREDTRGRLRSAVFTATIDSPAPLRSVYSPSHDIEVKNESPRKVTLGYESRGQGLDSDFVLYTSVSPQDLAVNLLGDRAYGDDGTFLLLVAPPRAADPQARIPKDVVFVIDTSGSMREEARIERAKRVLAYGLKGLGERDRYNLINFGTGVYPLAEGLLPASPDNVRRGLDAVDKLVARGGTHISDALLQALRCFDVKDETRRPKMIVFITDGHPTVGVTNPVELLALVGKNNREKVRVFSFGVGVDLSTRLLDELSAQNYGTSDFLDAKGDMEVAVSAFFDKVDFPALSDVELKIEGVDVYDLYPAGVSDLFFGEQLTILGRYRKPGKATVTVRGWKEDKQETYTFPDLEFASEARHEFVPRLWASRRIGYLLEQIRKNGEDKELVDEIVALGQRYGIPSPYASYLVVEDSEMEQLADRRPRGGPRGQRTSEEPGLARDEEFDATEAEPGLLQPGPAATEAGMSRQRETLSRGEDSGAGAVAISKDIQEKKSADKLDGSGAASSARHAAGRTFYLRGGVWVEAALLQAKPGTGITVKIRALEKAYFELAAHSDELRKILAVGERVRFRLGSNVVEVGPEGDAELSAETRKLLGL